MRTSSADVDQECMNIPAHWHRLLSCERVHRVPPKSHGSRRPDPRPVRQRHLLEPQRYGWIVMVPDSDDISKEGQSSSLGETRRSHRGSADTEAARAPQPTSGDCAGANEDDPSMMPGIADTPNAPEAAVAHDASATDVADVALEADRHVADRGRKWLQRKTVRALLRQYSEDWGRHDRWDDRHNEESRLASDEKVHLGGVTLVEAFTPSTVAELYSSLRNWQGRNPYQDRDWSSELQVQRASSVGGGWSNLGLVRPAGSSVLGMGFTDPTLPKGVDAVWLSVSYVTPSVAMVSATFTIAEEAGDLSEILRTDRRNAVRDVRLIVPGPLGRFRARIPWARPKSHGMTAKRDDVWSQKQRDVEAVVTRFEDDCGRWFYGNFAGRFSQLEPSDRPSVRMLFTEKARPFSEQQRGPLSSAGLGWSWDVFEGLEDATTGWWLSPRRPWREGRQRAWTVAARRSDAGDPDASDRSGTTNWSLTQRFGTDQVSLVALHALWVLLDEFGAELARLRDRAHRDRRIARPVGDARELNHYLLTDGLDASTVAPDVLSLTRDLERFRWGVPEYTEDLGGTQSGRGGKPLELVPALRRTLRAQAKALARKTAETDGNLKASAELQQAVANTRMQRVALVFTVAAVAISVASLYIALSSAAK